MLQSSNLCSQMCYKTYTHSSSNFVEDSKDEALTNHYFPFFVDFLIKVVLECFFLCSIVKKFEGSKIEL